MLVKLMRKIYKDQKGITGLETAIILIAFVVVAAVFAYTVLSAGLFATQKSSESVYSGLEETQSTLEIRGGVLAESITALDECDYPVGWQDTNSTIARLAQSTLDTAAGQGGLGAVSLTSAADADGTTVGFRNIKPVTVVAGDTITLWAKGNAAANGKNVRFGHDDNLSFASPVEIATDIALVGTGATTDWAQHTLTVATGMTIASIGIIAETALLASDEVWIDNIMVQHTGTSGWDYYTSVLDDCDYPLAWEDGTNGTVSRDAAEEHDGTACLAITMGDNAADNELLASRQIGGGDTAAALDFDIAQQDTIKVWIKATYGGTAPGIGFGIDDDTTFNADIDEQAITVTTSWAQSTLTVTADSTAATGVETIGFIADGTEVDNTDVIYVDLIEVSGYADHIVLTVATVLGGEPMNFRTTVDDDNDGLLSDEATKTHEVVVTYSDNYQTFNDLAWNVREVGQGDDDNLLEANEKFVMTIDLAQVNLQAEVDTTEHQCERLEKNRRFTLEIKPPKGAVLTIERDMPRRVHDMDDLH